MKTSCSLRKSIRLFALSLTLMATLSFGTFHTVRNESTRTVAKVTTHSPLLLADGQETHGDGTETHGGGGGKTHG